jgi:hypothetical protein
MIKPSRACLLQRDNMKGWVQSEAATATPGNWLKRTAVALNYWVS